MTVKIEAKTAEAVNATLGEIFKRDLELKNKLFKSVTSNNGFEIASLAAPTVHLKYASDMLIAHLTRDKLETTPSDKTVNT